MKEYSDLPFMVNEQRKSFFSTDLLLVISVIVTNPHNANYINGTVRINAGFYFFREERMFWDEDAMRSQLR